MSVIAPIIENTNITTGLSREQVQVRKRNIVRAHNGNVRLFLTYSQVN